ncbi:MAG: histidine phosphatase family protein [Gaiellaceae bacterium]
MTRRRIYLLRHGQVAYFVDGRVVHPQMTQLTEEGRRQSYAAAEALAQIDFDRVITSGLPRAVETAGIVAPNVAPESWPDLCEIEPGRLADLADPEAAFVNAFTGTLAEDATFLGGETIGSLLDRALPALQRLAAEPDWDIALVVAHGGTIRALLSFALTGGRAFLGNFELAPASISILDAGEDWIVRAVNVTPYDLAHTRTRLRTMEELWAQYKSMSSTTQSSS